MHALPEKYLTEKAFATPNVKRERESSLRVLQAWCRSLYDNGTIFFASDDNGDSDPNIVFLDGQVDVDLYNFTSGSLDTNANAVVSWMQTPR